MQDEKKSETTRAFERLAAEGGMRMYFLKLYITGMTPRSQRAIANIKEICALHLKDRHSLEIIDIIQHPILAEEEQIIAAPTLVKRLPEPARRFVGDLTNTERLLVGLDLSATK